MPRRFMPISRTIAAILTGALVVTCGSWWQARAVAQDVRTEIHHFPPTTLTAGQGYRLVFAHTGGAQRSTECHVAAGFVDASGQGINEERFSLQVGESATLDLRLPEFAGPTMLVRAVLRDEPAGCLSATSEVTLLVRNPDGSVFSGTSCWIVPASRIEVR